VPKYKENGSVEIYYILHVVSCGDILHSKNVLVLANTVPEDKYLLAQYLLEDITMSL
jgi:hypothetical protein